MMVVNGSGEPDNLWCQTVVVETNTEYAFSAWLTSVKDENPAQLQFSINGILLGNQFNASASTCDWAQFYEFWDSGTITNAEICIVNVNETIAGNDFALDDISFSPVCTLTDEININLIDLIADWTNPGPLCASEPAFELNTLLQPNATTGGQWTVNGIPASAITPQELGAGDHSLSYSLSEGPCNEVKTDILTISTPANAGLLIESPELCSNEPSQLILADFLAGEDTNGTWTETSGVSSGPGAFNATTGTFNTSGPAAGLYSFSYLVSGQAPCPNDESSLEVLILESPVADAGEDQSLECLMPIVSIGGSGSSIGAAISYTWSAANNSPIQQANLGLIDVEQPDIYTLAVTNEISGCSESDEVIVVSNIATFDIQLSTKPVSCNASNDGYIQIVSVSGGQEPYLFSLNDGPLSTDNQFIGLTSGTYDLRIFDNNDCDTTLQIEIDQGYSFSVSLNSDLQKDPPTLVLGNSTTLSVQASIPESEVDTIIWSPEFPDCPGCWAVEAMPLENTSYAVTVINNEGCAGSDSLRIFVDDRYHVFIPNVFSPNADGFNDIFYINAGFQIESVLNFKVLDRWGGMVFEAKDFQPNNPSHGWDGTYKGEKAAQSVYIYFAELQLKNGKTIRKAGSVALMQ